MSGDNNACEKQLRERKKKIENKLQTSHLIEFI